MTRGSTGRAPAALRLAVIVPLLVPAVAAADFPIVPGGTRVDGVVAVVGGAAPGPTTQTIFRSDVELRARITLTGRERRLYTDPLPPAVLTDTLEELVSEMLIVREAERVRTAQPDPAAVARQRRALEEATGGAVRLSELARRFNVPDAELDAIARRRAVVGAFLEANLTGATNVSEAELERAFATGEHPFVGHELDEVREPMRVWLARQALDRTVRRWVTVLRSRTPVRVLATFE